MKKDRQHNGQKKKDKQWSAKHTHKTKDRVIRTPLKKTGLVVKIFIWYPADCSDLNTNSIYPDLKPTVLYSVIINKIYLHYEQSRVFAQLFTCKLFRCSLGPIPDRMSILGVPYDPADRMTSFDARTWNDTFLKINSTPTAIILAIKT